MRRERKVYDKVLAFKKKFPFTIAWRLKAHSKVIEEYLNSDESLLYAFCGQKNENSFMWWNTCVIALTTKRILIAQKRLLFGHLYTSITPDLFNDIKVNKGIIWGRVMIDTVKEFVVVTNLDPSSLDDVETSISKYMLEEKKKYNSRAH